MNATNRVLNRLVLLLAGAALCGTGAWLLLTVLRPGWAERPLRALDDGLGAVASGVNGWAIALPGTGRVPGALVLACLIAVVIAICAVLFIGTRGGGRIRTVLREEGPAGETSVDLSVADAMLAGPLRGRAEVISADCEAARVRRAPAMKLTIKVRRGADLSEVLRAADRATAEWDRMAGTPKIPVVLHLADLGWLDRLRARTRVR